MATCSIICPNCGGETRPVIVHGLEEVDECRWYQKDKWYRPGIDKVTLTLRYIRRADGLGCVTCGKVSDES